ncbi:DUF4158 domain-containing protein [Streptomyces sp. NPDC096339]|uniref:DUF4158 domain-containing protein n=1 Tax=Streptomyces sp. NPDC096339 TaxID=3366086 RepID=UPI003817426D
MTAAAVDYVAQQVKVPAEAWADYDWQSKAIQRHQGEIRAAYGVRANTEEDQDRLAARLATELCPRSCRATGLRGGRGPVPQLPHRTGGGAGAGAGAAAGGQVRRLVGKVVKDFEKRFCRNTLDRLSHTTRCGWRTSSRATTP